MLQAKSTLLFQYIVINQIQRNRQWRFTWSEFWELWKLILCLLVCFVFNKVFLCRQTQISVHDFPASLPLSCTGYRHNVPCPVAGAKFSQDLENPSHFTTNVERKSKSSHLHFVLGLSEPIGSPGRSDPRMLCPHSWGMARGWVILYLPQSCSTDRRAKE